MGAAPTITHVLAKDWKVFFTWAMGSNFNTKFRMVGPWKWENGAVDIMQDELFNVVQRSGGYVCKFSTMNFARISTNLIDFCFYTIIPFVIFGILSILLYTFDSMCGIIGLQPQYKFKIRESKDRR